MKIFKVGFSTSRSRCAIGASLIRWYMRTPFSHVYLVFGKAPTELVVHATGKGLFPISRKKFLEHNFVVEEFEISVSDLEYDKIKMLSYDNMGTKYGYWQNIGILIAELLCTTYKKLNINKRIVNPFMDGVNCSEWVSMALKVEDTEAFAEFSDSNLISPSDVYKYLKKSIVERSDLIKKV